MKRISMLTTCIGVLAAAFTWSGCDDDGGGDEFAEARSRCVQKINAFRAEEGIPALVRWYSGEPCADDEAKQDAQAGTSHTAFGSCGEAAQNECPGWSSVDDVIDGCLQSMWDEGPGTVYEDHGHYINMSSTSYEKVACGFYRTSGGAVWSVQNFK